MSELDEAPTALMASSPGPHRIPDLEGVAAGEPHHSARSANFPEATRHSWPALLRHRKRALLESDLYPVTYAATHTSPQQLDMVCEVPRMKTQAIVS